MYNLLLTFFISAFRCFMSKFNTWHFSAFIKVQMRYNTFGAIFIFTQRLYLTTFLITPLQSVM